MEGQHLIRHFLLKRVLIPYLIGFRFHAAKKITPYLSLKNGDKLFVYTLYTSVHIICTNILA
jgi:hypothetical protein